MIAMTWTCPPGRPSDTPSWESEAPVPRETYVECRACGFEPPGQLLLPRRSCPKCHGSTWRRAIRPLCFAGASAGAAPTICNGVSP